MNPIMPGHLTPGALEMACYGCAILMALFTWLVQAR